MYRIYCVEVGEGSVGADSEHVRNNQKVSEILLRTFQIHCHWRSVC
jgi:hypothetical protein